MQVRIVGGGHSVVEVNGAIIGRFTEATVNLSQGTDEISGVDSSTPFELAPTITRVRGTLRMWRTTMDGGAEGAGLAAPAEELPRGLYFRLRVLDRIGGYSLFECDQAKVDTQNWTYAAKRLVTGTVDFSGIGWRNEVQVVP